MQPDKKNTFSFIFFSIRFTEKNDGNEYCKLFFFVTLWYGPVDHPTVPLWYCWYRRDCSLFCRTVRTQSAHCSFHTPMSIMTRIARRNPAIIVTHDARNTCPWLLHVRAWESTGGIGCEVSGGLMWLIYGSRVIFSRGSVFCLRVRELGWLSGSVSVKGWRMCLASGLLECGNWVVVVAVHH